MKKKMPKPRNTDDLQEMKRSRARRGDGGAESTVRRGATCQLRATGAGVDAWSAAATVA